MTSLDATRLSPGDIPAAVAHVLEDYLASRRPEVDAIGAPATEAVAHLESFVLGGGKRIRPLCGWLGFVGGGGLSGPEDPNAVLRAVSSLEFIQACALIHDDILDASDTRRGQPTVHRAVEQSHRDRGHEGDAAHFGESVAILVGDLALAWADDLFFDSGVSPAARDRAYAPWRAMRTEVIGGQLLDISLEASGSEDISLTRSVSRYKTAAYTIERPLHIGASLAGASPDIIEAFRGFGENIGIAFQLRDDILGVFGDPAVTGKPARDDLREGKRTELLAIALARLDASDPAAAKHLRAGLRSEDPRTLADLANIIADSGAPDIIEDRIRQLTATGLAFLKDAPVDDSVTALLKDLARRATERRF
ncbi:polyprenyl synthetase family protein [Corynebacterium uterequi]|uniref:Geranylgeranyl pyrophosphate synthase n=1 Tax=Corynebacterium uterequi TaxID=1072256 RepID=A0A0G3HDM4_9CORY|nr:polyprenyl synthetase family protein [Corynebacterium uterequi]AKK11471.1 geranylgeranyl pyrophosphate synthase [Corynebacterium uterequi]